jgi:Translation initiation factor IF-2, N-terminal region
MSKRVYEIARELDLSTKEVIDRLNDAGLEVKSHFAVVEDPIVERAFGQGANDAAAPNGRAEAQEAEAQPSMVEPRGERLPIRRRLLAYVLAGALALAVAAGIGAAAALIMLRDDGGSSGSGESQQPKEQANAAQNQQKQGTPQQGADASQQSEAEYVSEVGKIQSGSVEAFLDSHERFLHYDALTADDVHKMQANQATLQGFANQVDSLDPPQKYREQHEIFRSAIDELYEATKLAYALAADPTAATSSEFDEYDRQVDQAAAELKRSNEMLGRNYETIEGAPTEKIGSF